MTYENNEKYLAIKQKVDEEYKIAAKHYIKSNSIDEFKVKMAAEGIDDESGSIKMFQLYYWLHNTKSKNSRATSAAIVISFLSVSAFASLAAIVLWLCNMSVLWSLLAYLLVPIAYGMLLAYFQMCDKIVFDAIDDAERRLRYETH